MNTCTDIHCSTHGKVTCRGREFTGTVLDAKAPKTATVEWTLKHYLPKFERFESRKTHLHVHNPPCINAAKGDLVRIAETRKLSKTKAFVIIKKLGEDIQYLQREQALDRVDLSKRKKAEAETSGGTPP